MNWKRLALCALLGITMLGTAACGTKSGEQPQGNTVKAETVAMPNFSNAPIADEYAIFDTNYGQFKVRLLGSKSPITVKNFDYLVKKGFCNGVTFHRVIEGFMIQGGDPKGDGTGGSKETIKGEFSDNGVKNPLSHTRGALSMARSQDNDSASSQFFIVQSDSTYLDGQYAVFGYVYEGMDIVDQICKDVKVEDNNGTVKKENQPVIESIRCKKI